MDNTEKNMSLRNMINEIFMKACTLCLGMWPCIELQPPKRDDRSHHISHICIHL